MRSRLGLILRDEVCGERFRNEEEIEDFSSVVVMKSYFALSFSCVSVCRCGLYYSGTNYAGITSQIPDFTRKSASKNKQKWVEDIIDREFTRVAGMRRANVELLRSALSFSGPWCL